MAVTFFKVPINAGVLGAIGPADTVRVMVRTNVPEGVITYAADNWIFASGAVFKFKGAPVEVDLPTKVGANPVDFEFELTVEITRSGERPQMYGPFYKPAPTSTADAPLADWVGTSSVPASWMTAATASLQTYVDDAESAKTAAEAAKVAAQAAAVAAESVIVADLGTTDGQTTALINAPSSSTAQALSTTFGAASVAASGLRASLAAGLTTGLAVLGDSTGNDATEWPTLVAQALAAAHPEYTVQHLLWSDTAQDVAPPATLQTGTAGLQYLDTTTSIHSRTLPLSESPHTAGILDVRAKVRLSSWTAPAALSLIAARNGDAGTRSWYLSIGTTGKITFNHSTDGTDLLTKSSTVGITSPANTTQWVRVVYTPGVDAKFYTSPDGSAWTQLGITFPHTDGAVYNAAVGYDLGGRGGGTVNNTAHIFEIDIRDGLNGKPIVPRLPALWGSTQGNAAAVVGAPTFTVVNGSHPGADLAYWTQARIEKALPACGQRLGFVSLSHNELARSGPDFQTRYAAALALVGARLPGVPLVCLTQNPQVAPRLTGFIAAQATRRVDIMAAAARASATTVDTYQAFVDAGTASTVQADGVHPTTAGSQVWADAVLAATSLD
jgi:hypothetical protein